MIFLLMAAHDTTTTTLTSMAYQVAKHPEWQERCRREALAIDDTTYDALQAHDRHRPGDEGVHAALRAGARPSPATPLARW